MPVADITPVPPPPPPGRREREKLQRREEILASAAALFAERGYHGVTMHEIAARAEFSIGTLYSFFANKEDLYKELMLGLGRQFEEALDAALASPGDEAARLEACIATKGRVFDRNLGIIRLYYSELMGASYNLQSDLRAPLLESHMRLVGKLEELLRSGVARGVFGPADPAFMALTVDTMTTALLLLGADDPRFASYPEAAATLRRVLIEPILIEPTLARNERPSA